MIEKGKQLTLSQRNRIEEMLNQRRRKYEIANELDKTQSTIAREINKHRILKPHNVYKSPNMFNCKYFNNCKVCTDKCKIFQPISCKDRDRNIGVCNNCSKLKTCNLDKYFYFAEKAHEQYKYTLTDSRQGVNLNTSELIELAHLICPLIKKGQSIAHIYATHAEDLKCSKRTTYTYIDAGIFEVRNIDLRRKVKYKKRKKATETSAKSREYRIDHNYEDFQKYIEKKPDVSIVEMDCVEGNAEGHKVLLTFTFRKTNLMLIFLLENQTREEVLKVFAWLEAKLGTARFKKLFEVILTDGGSEFADRIGMETATDGKTQRTIVFYCDPYSFWQKGCCEKNHEYIRYVRKKGSTFDDLDQKKITLLANHINNTKRDSLNGHSPFELSQLLLDKHLLAAMRYKFIAPDDVMLTPELIK